MSKSKAAKEPQAESLADPTSDRIVLAFLPGPRIVGTPNRDLTAADLARLVYEEGAAAGLQDGTRPDPRQPDHEAASALVERLVATGRYATNVDEVLAARADEAEAAAATEAVETAPADPATAEG